MKAVMLSQKEIDYANHHLHDGLETTIEGLNKLFAAKLITLKEHDDLLQQAITRHLSLWRAFTNKLVQKTLCWIFAILFSYMQINGTDLEMRRSSRGRTTRTSARRSTRRSDIDFEDYYQLQSS